MQLILAIDSDPRRSEQLANLVRSRLQVDLVQATSAGEGLHALRDRVPDLILTSPLLSPFDDGVLDEYLRDLGSAATHVQTVRIPMLSTGPRKKSAATRLFSLGRTKKQTSSAAPDGCDPKIFADEITHYLTRSLEERTASAKPSADMTPRHEPRPAVQPSDEWGAPDALVQEFRAPIERPSAPVKVEPIVDAPHVPGSILDLRTPIVHAPAEPVVVEPEPAFDPAHGRPFDGAQGREMFVEPASPTYEPTCVTPEPTYVMPEPSYVTPEPTYVTPQPSYVRPEPSYVKPEPAAYVEPAMQSPEPIFDSAQGGSSIVKPAVSAPAPATTTTGNSASFEAALAAIRAAWAKPETTASKPESKKTAAAEPAAAPAATAKPLAGSGEVDLTTALEDIGDGTGPADDEEHSPEGSTTNGRRKVEKPRKRQEKPRERKMRSPDGRDDWGVFDPNTCEFSTLVNKLDEVTDSDETPTRATNGRGL